jgi:3-hydroxybutyryl-CoA dehydrogenase
MKLQDIDHIGILGAGLMGPGIAQAFSSAGYRVKIFDKDPAARSTLKNRMASNFKAFINLNLASPEDRERCLENVSVATSMKNLCDGPQVLIEAISEDLEVKRNVYGQMEKCTPADTILTSNTSALSITAISEALKHKTRFLGTHFWNPPQIIPCVEVIMGAFTEGEIFETVYSLMEKIKKVPVRVRKDIPGFLGNRLQHAMWREAIALKEKNVASAEDIDKVVKYGFGVRMPFIGPLETADLAGLALTFDIQKYLFPYLESSPAPSPALKDLVCDGATGTNAGRGFYDWTPEKIRQIIQQRDTVLLRIIYEIIAEIKHV